MPEPEDSSGFGHCRTLTILQSSGGSLNVIEQHGLAGCLVKDPGSSGIVSDRTTVVGIIGPELSETFLPRQKSRNVRKPSRGLPRFCLTFQCHIKSYMILSLVSHVSTHGLSLGLEVVEQLRDGLDLVLRLNDCNTSSTTSSNGPPSKRSATDMD